MLDNYLIENETIEEAEDNDLPEFFSKEWEWYEFCNHHTE